MLTVQELMTPEPLSVEPDASAAEVTEIMRRLQVRHVPVIDGAGALVGIISDRDILRRSHDPGRVHGAEDLPLARLAAKDLMTYVVISVTPDTPVFEASRRMLDAKVSCLPVVDKGRLVGILTEADYVRALSFDDAEE